VIFTSEGKDFSVGDDLKYTYDLLLQVEKLSEAIEFLNSYQILTRAMLAHPGVIIAGIKGWCIGGAFEMTLSCDLRIAADDTKIMTPEVGIGMVCTNASTFLLPRIIGEGKAKELMYLGKELSAEKAYELGLVNEICKPQGLNRILNLTANTIVQKDHEALRATKKLINERLRPDIEAALDSEVVTLVKLGQSESLRKRLEKFVKKKDTKQ
jgi:enoyl-CoA hydratase